MATVTATYSAFHLVRRVQPYLKIGFPHHCSCQLEPMNTSRAGPRKVMHFLFVAAWSGRLPTPLKLTKAQWRNLHPSFDRSYPKEKSK